MINRKPCGKEHPKLKEILHGDFSDFSAIEQELVGYNAAYLCMGTTSFMMSEENYSRITHDMTLALAQPLSRLNPNMTVCYVSGAGTDSSENGRLMWTNVKGKTENDLLKLPFRQAFMFRAGLIQPTKGLENAYLMYKLVNPIIPLLRKLFPGMVSSLREIGQAMIEATRSGYKEQIIEVKDIVQLAADNQGKK